MKKVTVTASNCKCITSIK